MLKTGSEILHEQQYQLLAGQRVGLLTNPSAVDAQMRSTYQKFLSAEDVNLMALYGAEHGSFGQVEAGEHVDAMVDSATGIAVHSLYGATYRPTADMLQEVDVMVCDIQDIGIRYYTYLWTITHVIEACGKIGLPVIVLDRPNPLGDTVCGRGLNSDFASLVGRYDIPMQHGMTIGEMLLMHNSQWNPTPADLTVIACENYHRQQSWSDFARSFVPTSPNMPHLSTVKHYVGACLIEGTTLSEGRGTTLPFEIVGAPYIDSRMVASVLNDLNLSGVHFRPHQFIPTMSKYANEACEGIQVHRINDSFDALHTWITIIHKIKHHYPDKFAWQSPFVEGDHPPIDKLTGSADLRIQLDNNEPVHDVIQDWDVYSRTFRQQREPYLIYESEKI